MDNITRFNFGAEALEEMKKRVAFHNHGGLPKQRLLRNEAEAIEWFTYGHIECGDLPESYPVIGFAVPCNWNLQKEEAVYLTLEDVNKLAELLTNES